MQERQPTPVMLRAAILNLRFWQPSQKKNPFRIIMFLFLSGHRTLSHEAKFFGAECVRLDSVKKLLYVGRWTYFLFQWNACVYARTAPFIYFTLYVYLLLLFYHKHINMKHFRNHGYTNLSSQFNTLTWHAFLKHSVFVRFSEHEKATVL